jgi:hypothetical protein
MSGQEKKVEFDANLCLEDEAWTWPFLTEQVPSIILVNFNRQKHTIRHPTRLFTRSDLDTLRSKLQPLYYEIQRHCLWLETLTIAELSKIKMMQAN